MRSCSRDSAASKSYVMTQASPEEQVHAEASDESPSCMSARVIEKGPGEEIVSTTVTPHRPTHGSVHAGRVIKTPHQRRTRMRAHAGRGVTCCIFHIQTNRRTVVSGDDVPSLCGSRCNILSRRLDHHKSKLLIPFLDRLGLLPKSCTIVVLMSRVCTSTLNCPPI